MGSAESEKQSGPEYLTNFKRFLRQEGEFPEGRGEKWEERENKIGH